MNSEQALEGSESFDLKRRFSAIERLYGSENSRYVRSAHVAVVGIGGVGSWVAEALIRSGVGAITLVDMDHISESNINRQVHALTDTLGMSKVEAMARRLQQINPIVKVICVDDFVTPENWPGMLPSSVNAVVDACDQMTAKFAMASWALDNRNLPFIAAGAAGGKRLAQAVEVQDIGGVTHDPLLAKLRYRLRRERLSHRTQGCMNVACVFSREPVKRPRVACDATWDQSLNCHGYGSSVAVTGAFGMVAAGWVIERLSLGEGMDKKTI